MVLLKGTSKMRNLYKVQENNKRQDNLVNTCKTQDIGRRRYLEPKPKPKSHIKLTNYLSPFHRLR